MQVVGNCQNCGHHCARSMDAYNLKMIQMGFRGYQNCCKCERKFDLCRSCRALNSPAQVQHTNACRDRMEQQERLKLQQRRIQQEQQDARIANMFVQNQMAYLNSTEAATASSSSASSFSSTSRQHEENCDKLTNKMIEIMQKKGMK